MDSSRSSLNLCSTCGKSFDSKLKLNKHISQVHDMRPRPCKECGEVFEGSLKLSNHMKTHKTCVCNICLKTIPKNSVTSHKYQCKGISMMCSNCSYETTRPDTL